jgi:ligand-binding sensor domain-containing protein
MMRRAIIALGMLLAWGSGVYGLNPALDVNQYAHTAWNAGENFPGGIIFAIAQTHDGYLWLGTEFGLLRFDGVRSIPWQPPAAPPRAHRAAHGARRAQSFNLQRDCRSSSLDRSESTLSTNVPFTE